MPKPEITVIEGLSVDRLFPALAHEAIQAASQSEIDLVMQDPHDPYRQELKRQFIHQMGELTSGELTDSDFVVAEHIEGFKDYAEDFKLEPRFVPEVTLPLKDIADLYPIRQRELDEDIAVTALDVIRDYPEGRRAVRLIDARGILGTRNIDDHELLGENGTKMKRQDWRMLSAAGIELDRHVYPRANMRSRLRPVELPGFDMVLYNTARDTGRTYFRYGHPITKNKPTDYAVELSLIRLADCARKEGEDDIYWRLFHRHLN